VQLVISETNKIRRQTAITTTISFLLITSSAEAREPAPAAKHYWRSDLSSATPYGIPVSTFRFVAIRQVRL